jgi:hypothetical protein
MKRSESPAPKVEPGASEAEVKRREESRKAKESAYLAARAQLFASQHHSLEESEEEESVHNEIDLPVSAYIHPLEEDSYDRSLFRVKNSSTKWSTDRIAFSMPGYDYHPESSKDQYIDVDGMMMEQESLSKVSSSLVFDSLELDHMDRAPNVLQVYDLPPGIKVMIFFAA